MISTLTGAGRSERSHAEPDCESKTDLLKIPLVAPIAQSAERLHGKEKVKGSIPFRGSGRGFYRSRCGGVAQLVRAHDS